MQLEFVLYKAKEQVHGFQPFPLLESSHSAPASIAWRLSGGWVYLYLPMTKYKLVTVANQFMIPAATTKSLVKLEVDQSGHTIPLCLCGLSVWQAFKYTTGKNQQAGIQHLKAVQTYLCVRHRSWFQCRVGHSLSPPVEFGHSPSICYN